jgi:hypothetical protein
LQSRFALTYGPARAADVTEASTFAYAPLLVRPAEGSASTMFGTLHLWIGTPPNPVFPPSPNTPPSPICALPAVQSPNLLLLCGYLRNPGGETLQSADLIVTLAGITERIRLLFVPPSPITPCETIFVSALALTSINPGPPDGNPGPPDSNPGPPTVLALLATDVGLLTGQSAALQDVTEEGQLVTPPNPIDPSCTVQAVR